MTEYLDRVYGLHKIPKPGEVDVLAGGPPCQGFSGLNMYKLENPYNDEKNQLFFVMLRIAQLLRPKYVLIENVTGLFSNPAFVRSIHNLFETIGYNHEIGIFNSLHYGLPQSRPRVIYFATPKDAKWQLPQYPSHTHTANITATLPKEVRSVFCNPTDIEDGLFKQVSVLDFISDLPEFHTFTGHKRDPTPYRSEPRTVYQDILRSTSTVVTNHESRGYCKKVSGARCVLQWNQKTLAKIFSHLPAHTIWTRSAFVRRC